MTNIIGELGAEPVPLETATVTKLTGDALFDETDTFVSVGGIPIPIKFLFWETEMRLLRIMAPYQKVLIDGAIIDALDETLGALLVEAVHALDQVAVIILHTQMDVLPIEPVETTKVTPGGLAELSPAQIEAAQMEAVRAWVRKNGRFDELADLVLAQIKRNNLGKALGKLWEPGAQRVKALRTLNTLVSQIMPGSDSNSTT